MAESRRGAGRLDARPIPTRPVRTSSLIPCGRQSSWKDSSSSGVPATPETTPPGPRTTARAPATPPGEAGGGGAEPAGPRPEHLREGHQLGASVRRDRDLDQQQLALERLARRELGDAEDVDELVHLLLDLLERVLLAVHAPGDAGGAGGLGRAPRK